MNAPTLLLAFGGLCAVLMTISAVLLLRELRVKDTLSVRMDMARGMGVALSRARSPGERFAPLKIVAGLGLAIVRSGLLSSRTLADLEQTLVTSGFRAEGAIGLFIGSKLLLALVLPVAAFLALPDGMAGVTRLLLIGGGALLGLLAPDTVVSKIREAYRRRLERGLPDALDMLVICAQAGLGLQAGIVRVSIEIRHAHPEIADELALTASEMQVLTDSKAALLKLGDRTGVESLRRLTATLAQSIQYGTPLADAMRSLAAELRAEMLTRFEERAARLPVLLTIPMVLFILPCLMIVVGGPAAIQLFRAF